MKKVLALIITAILVLSLAACGGNGEDKPAPSNQPQASEQPQSNEDINAKSEGVMTYAEFIAAAEGDDVVIEGYVQGKQSWWNNKATLYLMDKDGAYFVYNAACSEDDYAKLENGTKVKVIGKKELYNGEIEVGGPVKTEGGATIVIEEGKYIADTFDATALLGNNEELIKHQNEVVSFKGLTVAAKTDEDGKEYAFFYNYNNSGEEGSDSDLYFDATIDGKTYAFVVEYYLCNEETDVYKAVQDLKVGDVIDVEGFLYWYNGPQTQITKLTVKAD